VRHSGIAARHLVLLRHAKSAWPSGVPDSERPLAGKGRRRAHATGEWLASEGPAIDLVLCSPARRAEHTGELIRPFLPAVPWRREPRLYEASAAQVLDVVRQTPDAFEGVLVIGHEPSLSELVLCLADSDSDPDLLAQVRHKFPTSAAAVLGLGGSWSGLGGGRARLERVVVVRTAPRA
jgi:phosphohistidine phosphatase